MISTLVGIIMLNIDKIIEGYTMSRIVSKGLLFEFINHESRVIREDLLLKFINHDSFKRMQHGAN